MLHCLDIKPNISINAIQTYYLSEEVIFYPGAISQFGANLHHLFIWTTPMIEMKWCQQCNFSTQNIFTYREKNNVYQYFKETINTVVQIIQSEHSAYRFL